MCNDGSIGGALSKNKLTISYVMCVEKVRVCNQTAGKAFSVGVD